MTPFAAPAYVEASAAHDGGVPATIALHGVRLTMVERPDGGLHTPYGYPQPEGESTPEALREAVGAALGCRRPWRVALAPLGRGAALASAFAERLSPAAARPICIHDLGPEAPDERFEPAARSMIRRALRAGAEVTEGPVDSDFGRLYRAAMDATGAPAHYHFQDAYLERLNAAGGTQFAVRDDAGLAAAAVFLIGSDEATYHLSARRAEPPPAPGSANLLIAAGLRRCAEAGAAHCYLGGGRGVGTDDALLRFKRAMATRVVQRPTFEHAP